MDGQPVSEGRKSFLQNDPMLVGCIFVFFCICILAAITATFWGLNRRNQTRSANATQTAMAISTQQAIVSATAVARITEQAQYDFVDDFQLDSRRWFTGLEDNEYWAGSVDVKDGVYMWDVQEVKKTFVWWADFYRVEKIKDFDAYVDSKVVEGKRGEVCSGLVFRKSSDGWDSGAYVISVCNDSHFKILFHGADGWEDISGWEYSDGIHPADWNRIGIGARDNRFLLTINNSVVYEMTDDRSERGDLAVFIEVREENPAVIWFDNFGYQSR